MRWASSIITQSNLHDALDACTAEISASLEAASVSLLFVFCSPRNQADYEILLDACATRYPNARIVGCAAGGVIGRGREIEGRTALALTAAALPGVEVNVLHIDTSDLPTSFSPDAWQAVLGVDPANDSHFVILPDPFTFDTEHLLTALDGIYPKASKVGGLASGGNRPGETALFCDRSLHRSGAIILTLSGDIAVDTIVAQGCRPVGRPLFVTRADDSIIHELDRQAPMHVLQSVFESLPDEDKALFQQALFLGVEMSEDQQNYDQGDFLIRNIMGFDKDSEGLVVGARVHKASVVQFHLRDAKTSAEDLLQHCQRYNEQGHGRPEGVMLFSCMGRGIGLYGEPDHDSRLLRNELGDVPVGGFFCNGEIGSVGPRTFLHGYTSSFALFRSKNP